MTPHRLTRSDALQTARAFLAANQILQTLTPDEVIDILVSRGTWQITEDRAATAEAI